MEIEKLLEKVGIHFKEALLTGNYKFVKCGDCTAEILIDNKYNFDVWIANEPKTSFDFYQDIFSDNMELESIRFTTQKERMLGWKHMKPHVEGYRNKILKRQKQKEFNRLKKELEQLSSCA